jgi:hypothetical protein
MERDVLERATAFFAKHREQGSPSSPRRTLVWEPDITALRITQIAAAHMRVPRTSVSSLPTGSDRGSVASATAGQLPGGDFL